MAAAGYRPALRIGIIGAARVADYAMIVPAREVDGCEVVAIASRDSERARAFADRHGLARAHASYDALITDPDVDLVYLATPPVAHAPIALAAVRAGKPVLVEKPFAMSGDEAERVFQAAQAHGVPVFEAMHSPHHALHREVVDLVGSGRLGRLYRIEAHFDAPVSRDPGEFRWKAALGGGALMDLGVYPLAWARRLAGEDFDILSAEADIDDGVDARFSAELRFASGVDAMIGSDMIGARRADMTLIFDRGEVTIQNFLAPQLGHRLAIRPEGGAEEQLSVAGPSSFAAQLVAVRDAVRGGAAFPYPADDYVRSMRAIDRVRAVIRASGGPSAGLGLG